MTTNMYENFVAQETKPYMTENYTVIALGGEAGEVLEWYKKYVLKGNNVKKPLEEEDLLLELGDALFCITKLAKHRGATLIDIMNLNIKKHSDEKKEAKKGKK